MTLSQFFKSFENRPEILFNEGLDEFSYEKTITMHGENVGLFYGMIDTGLSKHFIKHIYRIDKDGYEVFEHQLSECMDGVWVNYGKPTLKRGRKIF